MLEMAVSKLHMADAEEVAEYGDDTAHSVIQIHDFTGWGWTHAAIPVLLKHKMDFVEKAIRLEQYYPGLFNRSELVGVHRVSPVVLSYRRWTAWRGQFPEGKMTVFPADVENLLPEAENYPREYSKWGGANRPSLETEGATVRVERGPEPPQSLDALQSAAVDGASDQAPAEPQPGRDCLANLVPPTTELFLTNQVLGKQEWHLISFTLVSQVLPSPPLSHDDRARRVYRYHVTDRPTGENSRHARQEEAMKNALERHRSSRRWRTATNPPNPPNPPDSRPTNNYGFETGKLRPRAAAGPDMSKTPPIPVPEKHVGRLAGGDGPGPSLFREVTRRRSESQLGSKKLPSPTDLSLLRLWARKSEASLVPTTQVPGGQRRNAISLSRPPLVDITKKAETDLPEGQRLAMESPPGPSASPLGLTNPFFIRTVQYRSTKSLVAIDEADSEKADEADDSSSGLLSGLFSDSDSMTSQSPGPDPAHSEDAPKQTSPP